MRTIKFIESLNIKEVPVYQGQDEFQYMRMSRTTQPIGPDEWADFGEESRVKIVPIHYFQKRISNGNPFDLDNVETVDTFIAYSEEVQDVLCMPLDALRDENERLSEENIRLIRINSSQGKELRAIESMSFFDRVKFVFGLGVKHATS